MAKRFAFNLDAAVPAAWDFLWAANLKDRAKQERDHLDGDFGKYGRRWYTRTFYICAVDVVAQVRSFAYETAKGQKWGTNGVRGPDYGIRLSGNVDGRVRDWLLRTKDGHNFDRGHISGMRFRPRGEPLGPSEKDTIEEKAKPKKPATIHFSREGYAGRPLCSAVAMSRQNRYGWRQSKARTRKEWDEVTCKRCLNLKSDPLAQPRKVEPKDWKIEEDAA